MKNVIHKILWGLLMCIFVASSVDAFDMEELNTVETLSTQSIAGNDVISPYHVTGEALVRLMNKMVDFEIPGSNIIFNRKTAQLFIRTTPSNHEKVVNILKSLRSSKRQQVDIEARIITLNTTGMDDIGLNFLGYEFAGGSNEAFSTRTGPNRLYGTSLDGSLATYDSSITFPNAGGSSDVLGGQISFGAYGGDFSIDSYIDMLRSHVVVNTLAAPRLIVANNQRANVKIEKSQFYIESLEVDSSIVSGVAVQTAYDPDFSLLDEERYNSVAVDPSIGVAESGTLLDVTPTINANGTISLNLHPQFVTVDISNTQQIDLPDLESTYDPYITLPVYNVQQADTTITVPNGGVAVIAGLIEEVEVKGHRKIPLLGDIPLLGRAFRNEQIHEEKKHLMIFVKATVRETDKSYIR